MSGQDSLRSIFAEFDTDGSGTIDLKELKDMVKAYFTVLGQDADEQTIEDACSVRS